MFEEQRVASVSDIAPVDNSSEPFASTQKQNSRNLDFNNSGIKNKTFQNKDLRRHFNSFGDKDPKSMAF